MRQWARCGTRPRQPADQRYKNAYLFGAICPARGIGAALALPVADTEAMQLHIDEISRHVEKGAHAVLVMDRAGWHTIAKLRMPKNITAFFLPSRAPELNPVENIWQYFRQNWLSNRVFDTYEAIIDAACEARQKLLAEPETSPQSECGSGPMSVKIYDSWYNERYGGMIFAEVPTTASLISGSILVMTLIAQSVWALGLGKEIPARAAG